jgi:hypothetical protein
VSTTTHTNAGTYASDTWSFTGTANYNNIAATTITDTINKANATINITPYTVTYDGNPHTATVTSITGVNGETGAMVGTVTLNTTHTAAGTYTSDTWSFTGAANYNSIAATTITDTINKANATINVTPYHVTYDGNPHTATGTATGVKSESLSGLDLSHSMHTNAGIYSTDYWTFTDVTGNYNNIAATTITDQIDQAPVSITPDGGKTKILGATFTAFTGVVAGLKHSDAVTVTYASTGAPAGAAVGSYDITVVSYAFTTGSASNYNITTYTAVKGLTVQYGVCLLYDPTRAVKSGATYPLKLYLCDVNSGDVSSSGIVVHASSIFLVSGFTGAPEDSGNANPDSDFRFDPTLGPSGGYIFNLQTKGLATGTYGYTFTAGSDPTPHAIMPGFGVK